MTTYDSYGKEVEYKAGDIWYDIEGTPYTVVTREESDNGYQFTWDGRHFVVADTKPDPRAEFLRTDFQNGDAYISEKGDGTYTTVHDLWVYDRSEGKFFYRGNGFRIAASPEQLWDHQSPLRKADPKEAFTLRTFREGDVWQDKDGHNWRYDLPSRAFWCLELIAATPEKLWDQFGPLVEVSDDPREVFVAQQFKHGDTWNDCDGDSWVFDARSQKLRMVGTGEGRDPGYLWDTYSPLTKVVVE